MVTPLRAPSDGPIGDSSLSVDDGTASILNQNDSHPLDLEKLLVLEARRVLHAGLRRDLVADGLRPAAGLEAELRAAEARRAEQARDVLHREGGRRARLPDGGAADVPARRPVPLQRLGLENDSIFTDQRQFLAHMRAERPDQKGYEFVPGTQVDLNGGG
jgi:UDP-MurNAc hydroxylase